VPRSSVCVHALSIQDALSFTCRVEEPAQTLHSGRPNALACKGASLCPNKFMKKNRKPPGFSFRRLFARKCEGSLKRTERACCRRLCLYLKTKNFHWHMSGQHFRDYHLLLDEHATQIFGITDAIAERVRKVGGITIHSIGHIARLQRITDNDEEFVGPTEMLRELHADTRRLWRACGQRMWSPLKPMTTQPPV